MNAWLVIKAFNKTDRREIEEILPAALVFGEEEKVIVGFIFGKSIRINNVKLTADDGLDAGFFRFGIELRHSEEVPVVGEGNSWHAKGFSPLDEVTYPRCAIQQAIFGMDVQVDEVAHV